VWAIVVGFGLLFPSCSTLKSGYDGYIEYKASQYIEFDKELLSLLSNNRRLIMGSTQLFEFTNEGALKEYQRLEFNHNLSVSKIIDQIRKGEDVKMKDFEFELDSINFEIGLFTDKLTKGEYKYNSVIFPIGDIILKEVAEVFVLDQYARIFKQRFSI